MVRVCHAWSRKISLRIRSFHANLIRFQNQLEQPGFGNGQIEQNLLILWRGSKGIIECLLGFVSLLIDEFPAHLVFGGQVADRL